MNRNNLLALAVMAGLASAPAMSANIIINNVDAPGVGFNDPTPAAPVGGNLGTTVGEQRLIAYRRALDLWGRTLKSDVTIVVQGSFAGLPCTASGGTLAQAGALQIFANFPNAPLTNRFYGAALANSIAGEDLTPGPLDPGPLAPPFNDDILANFNGNVGKPGCIEGPGWYYGLDSNPGPGQTDFLDVFMHEVAHGLGFQNFVNETTGASSGGLPDVYMANTLDLTTQKRWDTKTAAEIRASAIRNGRVVWTGPAVTTNASQVLGPYEGIRVVGGLSRELAYGQASFGPAPTAVNFDGDVVAVDDGSAALGSVNDGCEPFGGVAGKVALINRGGCTFAIKATNAQAAGAKSVMIANNAGGAEFEPGGTAPAITIPTVGIARADGDAIRTALTGAPVGAEYFTDPTRIAGAAEGYVRLYAPTTVALGSSISHFDTTASPNLLMEPFVTGTLRGTENLDLTPSLMQDIGWKIETLKIGACDTGVPSVLPTGAMLHASVDQCSATASNRGQFVSCLNKVTNAAKDAGYLTGRQHAAITSCAARR